MTKQQRRVTQTCIECGSPTWSGRGRRFSTDRLCSRCTAKAERENTHSDAGHQGIMDDCLLCGKGGKL